MKILLVGEFSGVHNNLKKELLSLGHYVKLTGEGDSYRRFSCDFSLAPYKGRFIGRLLNVFYFVFNIRKFIGYDVVQFIYPYAIPYYFHFFGLTYLIFKLNGKKLYYTCGTDPAYISAQSKFKYFPFDDVNSPEYPNYNKFSLIYYNWFLNQIDKIIPSMYSYALGYFSNSKLLSPIPLPGGGKFNSQKAIKEDVKIKILFGITRRDFKGSKFIIQALDLIQEQYSDKVTITIVERLSFDEYVVLLKETDILIDQCKSYDYGMNAIFAMEYGCVVFSGSEKEAMEYLKFDNCPVINILPDARDIFIKIEAVIKLDRYKIEGLKKESISFVKENHSSKKIASKFDNIYKK